ncbi:MULTISPECIES: response regulator transcription factor [Mumia]|uniref:response regulator transcription factor n=1 Tax=Mumia TaxID=1546255 RepID=UPI001420433A|nr:MULTISPECIES: response regulator transcription factor [unclassified Mumia]QMW65284.1 response regulator transcription factor [Mumia sp. ZJ1417]
MIRVLLAEDQQVVRGALVALLDLEDDLEVVAEVGTGDAIVPSALAYRPDVAVLDIDLPGSDGLTAAAELSARLPSCRSLMLTGNAGPGQLRRALEAQVAGFVLKTAPLDELFGAIRTVAAGGRVLDPSLAVTAWGLADDPLSPREKDVLRLLADGAEPPEIGTSLRLSTGTVRNHLTTVVAKLDARGRTDALRIAREAGWI